MSNVSQIYGTLRDSEPYIILNSTQTEVSGNLAVLQNLDVCGNITFNNTDLSTALSNLVVDLTGGQDASFTNVEISGNLILNNVDVSGKLTQIDASLVDLASGGGGGTTIQTNNGFVANYSGNTAGSSSVALLTTTGLTNQGDEAVAIGAHAGANSQDRGCIAIGLASGRYNQGFGAISVGWDSGNTGQGDYSVALGTIAGKTNLGTNSIAIGRNASNSNPNGFNNYIVLNGTGSALDPQKSNAFFVKPIQSATNSNKLLYNSSTGEITYQTDSGGGSTTIAARQSYKFVTTLSINTDYVIGYLSGSDYCETQFEYPSGFVISLASNGQNITSSGGENRGGYFKIPSSGVYNINGIVHFNLYIEGVNIILWYKRGSANGVKIAENYKQNNNSTDEQSVSLTITSLFDANIDDLIYMTIGNPNSTATKLSRTIPQGGDSVGIYFEIHKI